MEETQSASSAPVSLCPVTWRAARLSVDFVLDIATVSRGGGDLLQPLLLTAILEANQAEIHSNPSLQRQYGDLAVALPDDLRRPISINATAQSLGLPFETVRRRVRALVEAGLCVATRGGLYVPSAVVTSPAYTAVQAARVERLVRLHDDLVSARVLAGGPWRLPPGLTRAIDRTLAQFMLRCADPVMRLAGGAMNGLVLVGLWAASTDHLDDADWGNLPASYREVCAPCAATDLAERLAAPRETTRRHLLALEAKGLVARDGARWVAAAPPHALDALHELAAGNLINLRRLFARVAEVCADAYPAERTAER